MPYIVVAIFLGLCALFCGFICGSISGCNDSIKAKTQARMEEREQIRQHEEEDRQREADRVRRLAEQEAERVRKIAEEKQRRIDELAAREQLLKEALEAGSQNKSRDVEIRTFAMREVPSAWNAYLSLRGEIKSVNADISAYRQKLVARGVSPDHDVQYSRLKTVRNAMIRKEREMEQRLDAAYMESVRAQITPGGAALSDATRNDLSAAENGVSEVLLRYREIGGTK